MKATKITILGLVALTGLVLNSTIVLAEEVGNASTPAKIIIEKADDTGGGSKPLIPIDPLDPPTTGPLRIDAASAFDFGSLKLGVATSKDVVIPKDKAVGVQVTDLRGTGAGWTLTAKIDELKGKTNPTNILKATISIPQGILRTTNDGDTTMLPDTFALKLSNVAAPVMRAKKNNGLGVWALKFNGSAETVSIRIPSNAYIDNYSGNITWALQDAPM